VFVDVELETFNIDVSRLDAAITPKTRAIVCVHQLGLPCDLRAVLDVAARRGVPVIEDAACAIGSEIRWDGAWERIGRPRGVIACFSFHPRKLVSTGDGGMLTTSDGALDRRFRLLRQHGMSVPDTVRHASAQVIAESYSVLGFNYRMTDIQAAVGREQLKRLPEVISRRRALAARYHQALHGTPGVHVPFEPEWARSNWQSYAIRLEGHDQRAVMQRLLDAGVSTRRGVMNAHQEAAYPAGTWREAGGLQFSERARESAVILPLYHQMTDADQDRVIDAVRHARGSRS